MDRLGQRKLRAFGPQRSGTLSAETLGCELAYLLDGGDIARRKRADAAFPEMRGERHQPGRNGDLSEHEQCIG